MQGQCGGSTLQRLRCSEPVCLSCAANLSSNLFEVEAVDGVMLCPLLRRLSLGSNLCLISVS
jgi:hypothetical protein